MEKRWQLDVSVPLRGCGFEIFRIFYLYVATFLVSVPLRGCGFEIVFIFLLKKERIMVSVPLRGCGFEILAAWLVRRLYLSFRPLAGMWF